MKQWLENKGSKAASQAISIPRASGRVAAYGVGAAKLWPPEQDTGIALEANLLCECETVAAFIVCGTLAYDRAAKLDQERIAARWFSGG
jgi:hypothetical protein